MSLIPILISLVSGAAGGNAVGQVAKKLDLGVLGNSIAGILGGGLGATLLSMMGMGGGGAAGGGVDIGSIVTQIACGGAGGGTLMAIVGAIRQATGKVKGA